MAMKQTFLNMYHDVPSHYHLIKEDWDGETELSSSRGWRSLPILACFTSFLANLVFASLWIRSSWLTPDRNLTFSEPVSPFAGLSRNVPMQWNGNHAGSDEEWADLWANKSLIGPGIISLHDDYAREHRLPRSQRWPWEPSRGVYILNAYHNLHCVQRIRTSLEDFKYGREQSIPWAHVQHCLLTMRDEIHCNADDTPRYTGFQPAATSGYGQTRMCRDWSKLEAWALEHEREGCWRDIPGEVGVDGFEVIDRYRFCSEGNQYKEMAATKWLGQTSNQEDLREPGRASGAYP